MADYKYKSDEWYESEPVELTVSSVAVGYATVYNAAGASWVGFPFLLVQLFKKVNKLWPI